MALIAFIGGFRLPGRRKQGRTVPVPVFAAGPVGTVAAYVPIA
jgi:hypothetical protein